MGNPIHMSEEFIAVQNRVQLDSEKVLELKKTLEKYYHEDRYLMGDTKDLSVLDNKFEEGMKKLENLGNAMDQYWRIMAAIRKSYNDAQAEAIWRASKI